MVCKCANPSCSKIFRYLHEGKLYRLEAGQPNRQGSAQRGEWFWLCDYCAPKLTLQVEGSEVVAISPPYGLGRLHSPEKVLVVDFCLSRRTQYAKNCDWTV